MRKLFLLLVLLFSWTLTVFAAETQWRPAAQTLIHLDAALAQAKANIKITQVLSDKILPSSRFVAFPKEIPASQQKAYANFIVLKAKESYALEAATQADCDLSKTCLLGSLMLQQGGDPTIYYDRENKEATRPVALHQGIHGYFTRGFAMADFWPARLEWRYQEVLYTLSWQGLEDQAAFVKMANSVIDQLVLTRS